VHTHIPLLPIITAIASVYDWATHGDLQIKSNQFIYQPTQVQKAIQNDLRIRIYWPKWPTQGFKNRLRVASKI